jgi:putative transcriptional regulator
MHSELDVLVAMWDDEEVFVAMIDSRVREYRQQAGLSQEALARQVGVSRQTIVNVERGLSEPKVLLALAIAAVLGVAVSDLFRKGAGQ